MSISSTPDAIARSRTAVAAMGHIVTKADDLRRELLMSAQGADPLLHHILIGEHQLVHDLSERLGRLLQDLEDHLAAQVQGLSKDLSSAPVVALAASR